MEIENILRDILIIAGVIALIVICYENGQRTGYAIGQIKEMRQSMEDAGYVQKEPAIREDRK